MAGTKIIAFINYKGGVAKTTSTYHIGCWLAGIKNKRVLLVDIDRRNRGIRNEARRAGWRTFPFSALWSGAFRTDANRWGDTHVRSRRQDGGSQGAA